MKDKAADQNTHPNFKRKQRSEIFFCSVFNGKSRETVVGLTSSILSICFKIKLTHTSTTLNTAVYDTVNKHPAGDSQWTTCGFSFFFCLRLQLFVPALCIYLLKLDGAAKRQDKDLLCESYQHLFRHLRCRKDTQQCGIHIRHGSGYHKIGIIYTKSVPYLCSGMWWPSTTPA